MKSFYDFIIFLSLSYILPVTASMKKLVFLLFLSAIFSVCKAQKLADSLKKLLRINEAKLDSSWIIYYTAYLGYYYHGEKQYDSALFYYNRIINNKTFHADRPLLATTLNGVGACYNGLGYPDSSLNNYGKALRLFNELKDTVKACDVEANIAIVYSEIGLYEKALETSFSLLAKLIARQPDRALASCYNTIALVYESIGDFQDALDYHRKALLVRKSIMFQRGEALSYHDIGEAHRSLESYDSALSNLFRALAIKTALRDDLGSSSTLNSIGRVYLDLNKLAAAEQYLLKSLAIARRSNDKPRQAVILNDLSRLKIMRNKFGEAASYLKEAETLIRETKLIDNLRQNLELKVKLYKSQGAYAKALIASEELFIIKDSLLNAVKAKSLKSLEIKYETERKEQQIILLEQRDKISQTQLVNKQAQIKWLYIVLILVFVIASLTYYNFLVVRKNKKRIETLHKELHHRVKNNLQILSSILTLQSEQLTDKNQISVARSIESRINAMALIHRKLYNVNDNQAIEIHDYVEEVIQYLTHVYGFHETRITFNIAIPTMDLDVDKVIPIGLILNELISNAFKYAFVDHHEPRLEVLIQRDRARLLIVVGDNGKGFDSSTTITTDASFGIKMVGMLVRELCGNYSVRTENGTQYTINIPLT